MSVMVSVSNLHYGYPPPQLDSEPEWVLRGINLTVEADEFVSIMGPTGVGKTTFCLALMGIVPQSTGGLIRGQVLVNGLNTKTTPVASLAQHVGLVFQDPETQFLNTSVAAEVAFGLENLGVAPAEITERADWALALVGMSAYKDRSPFQLSGGQKQRVAIAAILAMTPKILVLDEPTASLDPLGKTEVFSVLRSLRQQRSMTVIMIEHDSEHIAEFSDRVVVFAEGQVALSGTPSDVFSRVEQMAEIGLAVPQVSELADCLNRRFRTNYRFAQFETAYQAIRYGLSGHGKNST